MTVAMRRGFVGDAHSNSEIAA